ncbi:MAG: ABC transporter permease [Thermoplasmata archaeon]|nr:ABC transporter permease [Thermoplasmata archaeon]
MTNIAVLNFKYDEHNRIQRWIRSGIIVVISLLLFVLVWWLVAEWGYFETIPQPLDTFDALISLIQNGDPINHLTLWTEVSSSLRTFGKGTALALIVAIPLGLLLGYVKPLRELAMPVIEVLRPIAPIAWAPIFIATKALGYTWGPALVVFMGMLFPILTSTIFGVQRIDSSWIDASKTLGANRWQIFYKIVLPSSVPYVLNGLKTALGVGWMCIVAAEIYATSLGGLGFFIYSMAQNFYWDYAFAGLIVVAVLGLLTTGVAEQVSKYVSRRMGME